MPSIECANVGVDADGWICRCNSFSIRTTSSASLFISANSSSDGQVSGLVAVRRQAIRVTSTMSIEPPTVVRREVVKRSTMMMELIHGRTQYGRGCRCRCLHELDGRYGHRSWRFGREEGLHGYLHLLGRRLLDRRRAWNLNMQIGRCDRLWNIWRRVNRLLLLLLLRLVL